MKFSYNWLQSYFKVNLPPPEDLFKLVGLKSFEPESLEKVGDDFMLEFDVLANRAHDCLCHFGLRQEIQALTGIEYQQDNEIKFSKLISNPIEIENQNPNVCRQYFCRVIKKVKVGPSPDWLVKRLATIGQKSINNIVDATNYIMFEIGQPLHAFDLDKIDGNKIIIRNAKPQETVLTLSGEEVKLDNTITLITDKESALAIAGIKGGKKAEVNQATQNIILESAWFEPIATRKSSRKIKIQTDSSKRFENTFSQKISGRAIEMVTKLIIEIAGDEMTEISEVQSFKSEIEDRKIINLEYNKIEKYTGYKYDSVAVISVLKGLGFEVEFKDNIFYILPSITRLDIQNDIDLIEEIARILGYDFIEEKLPSIIETPNSNEIEISTAVKLKLNSEGFKEIMTYVFQSKGNIEMENALATDKSFLRVNLETGVKEALNKNKNFIDYLELDNLKIFEIGYVFENLQEPSYNLALAFYSPKKKDNLDLKLIWQNLKEALNIKGEIIKEENNFIEIKLDISLKPNPNDFFAEYALTNQKFTFENIFFQEFSVFPSITRDLSFWYKNEDDLNMVKEIIQHKGALYLVTTPRIIDKFEKDNRNSATYRFVFQAKDRTLTDQEIIDVMKEIEAECHKNQIETR